MGLPRRLVLVVVAVLATATPLTGQSLAAPVSKPEGVESPAPLSLEEAVRLASERHPLVRAAAGSVRAVRGAAREAAAFPNPIVEWSREGVGGLPTEDRFLTASLPLDLSARRLALRSAVGAETLQARADSAALVRQVEYEAATAYVHAALATELLALETARREALEAIADFDANRLREGAVAEVAAMRARLEADRARLDEAEARAEASRARAELARAIAIPVEDMPPLEPLRSPRTTALDLESALQIAFGSRPELQAARAGVEAARHHLRAERRGVIPEVELIGGIKETAGDRGAVIGMSVPIPLFDRNGGARERASGDRQVAEAVLDDTRARVEAEVVAAYTAYHDLLRALPAERKALGATGEEVARIIEAAYREGGATLVEVLEARRAAAESRASELRWIAQLQLALLDLNLAIGVPLVEP